MRTKSRNYLAVAVSLALAVACTPAQQYAGKTAFCESWNAAELALGPRLPAMSEKNYARFSDAYALLSGGQPGLPPAKGEEGLCRGAAPPSAGDVVLRVMTTTVLPLVREYAPEAQAGVAAKLN